ncbi:hypothetical protein APED_03000 [Acanthopleuribacter pedis]
MCNVLVWFEMARYAFSVPLVGCAVTLGWMRAAARPYPTQG